ncbi:hypothetical protein IC620_06960 [Hazenella sp. IB182357]|uniref:Uncharacterized protein n=1 Tax=Polycladospora coralii TaxID=2771432 RepID=A0A926NEJ2_9BACL|nr:hypothetical protein [Polycladospora coralii]MBD1372099.1 hypothetical protein [Polycladospora coralii]MBS7530605.1 hypothetical protein [Polycladospora coralii]
MDDLKRLKELAHLNKQVIFDASELSYHDKKSVSINIRKRTPIRNTFSNKYILDKNTLAQIIYEIFYNEKKIPHHVKPIIIVIDPSEINGFHISGFYSFVIQEDKFQHILDIDKLTRNKINIHQENLHINAKVGIGYAIQKPSSAKGTLLLEQIASFEKELQHLIKLHGNLNNSISIPITDQDNSRSAHLFLYPIIAISWIYHQISLNND